MKRVLKFKRYRLCYNSNSHIKERRKSGCELTANAACSIRKKTTDGVSQFFHNLLNQGS